MIRIKAIFCVRGGYGTARIIDKLILEIQNKLVDNWIQRITVLHSQQIILV